MGLQPPKLVFFGINLPKRNIPPYEIFYKIWLGEGTPRSTPSRQISLLWLKNVGPQNRKKMVIFGINLPIRKNSRGGTEKVGYRCTTTNLPLCNDTIIVLKITLLHSVSVITNFVIPKRDRQKKHHTFSSTAGARPTIPTILGYL